jgi:hypothetical protein
MYFFDILLTLVHKEQLRWHNTRTVLANGRRFILVWFDCEIPECNLVISARCSEDGIFGGMPLNGRDRPMMPGKRGDW